MIKPLPLKLQNWVTFSDNLISRLANAKFNRLKNARKGRKGISGYNKRFLSKKKLRTEI